MPPRNDLEFYDLSAEDWWNPHAKIYALYHLNHPRFQFFDRHIPTWKGLSVLDVGCGGGYTCEFIAKRGAVVSGLDQSAKCIQVAQTHASSHGLKIDYQRGFAETTSYDDNTFDVVLCVDVLEHVADLARVIAEISRVLKPGGVFLFDTINQTVMSRLVMIWLLENILGEIKPGVHDWTKFIKPQMLAELMQNYDLENIEFKGFDLFSKAISNYIQYRNTRTFRVAINNNTSIMYIGKASKVGT